MDGSHCYDCYDYLSTYSAKKKRRVDPGAEYFEFCRMRQEKVTDEQLKTEKIKQESEKLKLANEKKRGYMMDLQIKILQSKLKASDVEFDLFEM